MGFLIIWLLLLSRPTRLESLAWITALDMFEKVRCVYDDVTRITD